MRVLLVEDDRALGDALADALAAAGIASDRAASAADAEQMLAATRYAAVLLDLGLPDRDGSDVLRGLRERGDAVPVVVLTARDGVRDRIAGLDAGADDYLVKPFEVGELLARLRAVLRRGGDLQGSTLAMGDLAYDPETRELRVGSGVVALSAREAELIALLLRRAGRVVAKRLAEDQLFGLADPPGSNAVEVYVHRLRRKLAAAGAGVTIETVRGVGYMMRLA